MNCGTQIDENTKFCPNCGTAQNVAFAPVNQNPTPAPAHINPVYAGNGAVRNGVPAPCFSDRVNDPRILAAVKKNRRAAGVFTFFLVPLPLIGFSVYSMVSGKMELGQAAMIGGVISVVFLIFPCFDYPDSDTV